jgi:hypothetical protein
MATLNKTAGAAGSIAFQTKNTAGQLITPVSPPTAVWYTDSARTAGAVSLTVTGTGSSWTASWVAGSAPVAPATRYLKFTIEVSAGVFDVDADDEIAFVDAIASVIVSPFTSDPAEVSSRWRTLTAAEQTVATRLLDDAAAILLARVSTIPARVAAGTLNAALVKRVQAAMVQRVLSNPDGKRQESIDDYAWTRDNALSAGMLYATADEIAELLPVRSRARSVTLQTHSTPR